MKMHLGALCVDINHPAAPVQKSAIDIINYVNEKKALFTQLIVPMMMVY